MRSLAVTMTLDRVIPGSRRVRLPQVVLDHPVLAVLTLAFALRLVAIAGMHLTGAWPIAPDEQQYVELAGVIVAGKPAAEWDAAWGEDLFDQTATFLWPVVALFAIFGPHAFLAQIVAAAGGALAAGLTCRLALLSLPVRGALAAGLVPALLPSQVMWSSLVLRESLVWACLALVGLLLASALRTADVLPLALKGIGIVAALAALDSLRPYVFICACYALVLATIVARAVRRVAVPLAALVIALILPLATGTGVAGLSLVGASLPFLDTIRNSLAIGAESAIVEPTPQGTPSTAATPSVAPAAARPGAEPATAPAGGLRAVPRGILAVALRPYPWEPATGRGSVLAKAENVVWAGLYVLAGLGMWMHRRNRTLIAFPVAFTAGFVVMSALFEGNVGTAFRHRGQVLWAITVLAALGAAYLAPSRVSIIGSTPTER